MQKPCIICRSLAEKFDDGHIQCSLCGRYSLGDFVGPTLKGTYYEGKYDLQKLKSALFYYLRCIRHNHLNSSYIQRIVLRKEGVEESGDVSLDSVYSLYPEKFSDKIDKIMELLASEIVEFGSVFHLASETEGKLSSVESNNIFFMPTDKSCTQEKSQRSDVLRLLEELGYIKRIRKDAISFTPEGWEKVDSLQRVNSNTAFIAMSFNFENPKIKMAEECIRQAISEAGYIPQIISDKEHNNFIMEEILYEIKNSAFVVADLTEQNQGVYYEAGYAKALGKEVILTCHESDFDNRHFDTKQINTIKWDKEEDFVNDLKRRIQITVGYNK